MVERNTQMLDHLRAIRGDVDKMSDCMRAMNAEMAAVRQHLQDYLRRIEVNASA